LTSPLGLAFFNASGAEGSTVAASLMDADEHPRTTAAVKQARATAQTFGLPLLVLITTLRMALASLPQ
jgi:hypothetical protein